MPEVFMLGGRAYCSAATQTTFEHDAYIMALLRKHGVVEAIESGGDVLAAILESGQTAEFLAAMLVVDGTEWNRLGATTNARTFNSLTDPEEKRRLFSAVESLLAGFFLSAGSSSIASPISSETRPPAKAERNPSRPRVPMPAPSPASGATSLPSSPSSSGDA